MSQSTQPESTYAFDGQSTAEMNRLIQQDRFLTNYLVGVLLTKITGMFAGESSLASILV